MTSLIKNTSSKTSPSQSTCSVCKRLLYSFEEVLRCRVCHDSCHWRCVERRTISQYGDNQNYICDACNDGTRTNSSDQTTNGHMNIKPSDSVNRSYRDFVHVPSKTNSTGTSVDSAIRYFEEKQQQSKTPKMTQLNELDRYLPVNKNEIEYHHHNGQDKNDSRTSLRIQQQQPPPPPPVPSQKGELESDNENDTSAMFQANYTYTPLKEYASARSNRATSENNINDYQNSTSDRVPTSRYGGGLHYTDHGYNPLVSRLVETPLSGSTHVISPTVTDLPNRQRHFVSTTNLSITEQPSHHQQQETFPIQSTSYLSRIRDNDLPTMKSSSQQHRPADPHSIVDNDPGVNMTNSNNLHSHENAGVEKKLTDLVQQLSKQLENDAQKMNEKLESKLKNLENMIHQQTHIIQRQDQVIEQLKSKILQIETERDQVRDRLSEHEQRGQNETKTLTSNENERLPKQQSVTKLNDQLNRSYSNSSTTITDNSKISTKKTPAPRINHQWSTTTTATEENKPTLAKLMKSNPINRQRLGSDSSSMPSINGILASSVPLVESPSAASSRLDNIIHQPDTKDTNNPLSSSYSLAQVRHQDRSQIVEPISMTQEHVVTTVHHEESDDDHNNNNNNNDILKSKRSSSSSSSSSTSTTQPVRASKRVMTSPPDRNSNIRQSFESLQNSYSVDEQLRPSNTVSSLEINRTPVQYEDSGSIYITPVEGSQPAIQANSIVKGWLRKQNRDSYLKRIERFYCILANNALLMHRNEHDRTPVKAINLRGAKVLYYDDARHGPSLELSWSSRSNDPKHYHLYAPNPQEAEQWVTGIQSTIHNLETNNKWQKYRLNI